MTRERRKHRSVFGWVTVAAVVGILVYYNISLGVQQRSLSAALAEVPEKIDRLKVEFVEGEYARGSAEVTYNRWRAENDEMSNMLQHCKSRQDFVVRSGPRIAWSVLCGESRYLRDVGFLSRKLGVYLPAGRHWLKYAFATKDELSGIGYAPFEQGNPRAAPNTVSVELGPKPEVYELELRVGADDRVWISLRGPADTAIHENDLRIKTSESLLGRFRDEKFAFPGELIPREDERPYFIEPTLPPVTDLGYCVVPVRGQGIGHTYGRLRLWIESNARPCMPAIYVAANYGEVTSLRHPDINKSAIGPDSDTEFARLFEPYDGSGRFIFREDIFLRPYSSGSPAKE